MDAIDFTNCKRDIYHLFIMFHNMALCYQKMQLLEECAQCIEHAFEHLPISLINLEEKSISYRMRKVYIIGKLYLDNICLIIYFYGRAFREVISLAQPSITDGFLESL
jgi:hypothetical protein